ncbi:MAG TPA: DUF4199 domain-containing protein [Bacteroidales bacterium]|nr:DUF4199 domain-containing protein [Bacteroidales bacterium]
MNTTTELFKKALMVGLMIAGAMILVDMLLYVFDLTGMGMIANLLILIVTLAVYFGFYIWGGRKYRNELHGGYLSYGKAIMFCVAAAVVSSVVLVLYNYLFYNFFDPQRAANEVQLAINIISENDYIPDEKKEEIIQGMIEGSTPGKLVLSHFFNSLTVSVIIAVIAALFVRKKEKITDGLL